MVTPLLATKLFIPRWRRGLVPRPRLTAVLNRGVESKLTLVSAPAGFGKSTLLAEWLAAAPAEERSVAWLSLDQTDNDPTSFWTYLISALQTAVPAVGAGASSLLRSPQPPPIETVLATMLNDLSAISIDVVLVLDDYHLIDARDIHDGMLFLLDHLPPRLHLVIASRADPTLALARLRARGDLVEIRAAELRFTPDEAAAYLNDAMGLDLTAGAVATLEERTEGWIAALQLAALSMQGRPDVTDFIAGFAGDDRYIVDYLVEEVLQRQPERVRTFLQQTSVLDRLSGPLCDAVTGQDSGAGPGKAMLENLERANLFLVPLDDRRGWYRYHHLFADVLRARLMDEQPAAIADLHRRASAWYERNGERSEAVQHALAAEDFARAADLVELAVPALRRDRQEATLLAWLRALPDELLRCRPVLSNVYAGELLARGELAGVDPRLRDAERWLDRTANASGRAEAAPAEMVVVDEGQLRRLPGAIAVHRAGLALVLGNVASTVEYARRALDLAPEDDHLGRGAAAALLGLASWASGDLEPAHQTYAAGMASLQRAGHNADALGCAMALADIRIAQGRLREAMRTYEQALQLQMSFLERMSGPLCDAVTGQDNGNITLEALDRGNLFVVPLDDKRRWYRYHHLFADVLQARLRQEQPEVLRAVHERASAWYERHSQLDDAIRHALAAPNFQRAAGLIELVARAMVRSHRAARLREWIKALPDDVVRVRPVLCTYYAFAILGLREMTLADARLNDAERWLDAGWTRLANAGCRWECSLLTRRSCGPCRARSRLPDRSALRPSAMLLALQTRRAAH